MNLKILAILLFYYATMSGVFLVGASQFSDYSINNTLNSSALTNETGELDTGGLFGSGVSFTRFAGLIGFGIGLPDDTPTWFSVAFGIWQSVITLFSIAFVISSIWDG